MTGPRVVVFAYSDVGHACLDLLIQKGVNVVAVYSHADSPTEQRWFPSVADRAKAAGIPVRLDVDLKAPRYFAALKELAPQLILSFYYREILPPSVLTVGPLGAYNMHGSLLPKYRGRAPVNWAVALGEKETGATLHLMTKLADAGDVVDQEAVPIGPDDLAAEVQVKVRDAAVKVLARQLDNLLTGKVTRKAQVHQAATKFGRRKPQDGEIDWTRPAGDVHNLVRAVSHPYPGAFTTVGPHTLHLWRTKRVDAPAGAPRAIPGGVHFDGDHSYVSCGDGKWLEILQAQVNDEPELEGGLLAKRLAEFTTFSQAKPA
jgi:methionyl-tRNA formyltransferase